MHTLFKRNIPVLMLLKLLYSTSDLGKIPLVAVYLTFIYNEIELEIRVLLFFSLSSRLIPAKGKELNDTKAITDPVGVLDVAQRPFTQPCEI